MKIKEEIMIDKKYTLAIIGGGPAGIAAALEASRYSKSVVLISQEKLGGRALWHSLTPSKVWLHGAGKNQPGEILHQLESVQHWQFEKYSQQINAAGIDVIYGAAHFVDDSTLAVQQDENTETVIHAEKIIVAAGSVPVFPDGLKPDGQRIIAPRLLGRLNTVPKSIIVVGGGVTGSEMAFLFNTLGSQVTVVTDMNSLLPRTDREVSDELERLLIERGVVFHKNVKADSIENKGDSILVRLQDGREMTAEYAFVAIGRKADVSSLNLEHTGIGAGELVVDEFCQTQISSIYAAGDVTGAPMTANRAMAMAKVAARNALTEKQESVNENWIVEAVYTEPQVAQVGDVSGQFDVYRSDFSSTLKSHITKEHEGFIKICVDEKNVLVGASAIGPHAADVMFSAAVAIRAQMPIADFQQVVPANPTLSEVFSNIGLQ
jgi:dihydrolipoamide dehydrogenase